MKENKSIDGLVLRDTPKKTSSDVVAKKTPAKKAVNKPKTTTTVKKVASKPKSAPAKAKPTPKPKTIKVEEPKQTVEDFLKPVQAFDIDGETGELKESDDTSIPDKKAQKKADKAAKKDAKKARKAEKKANRKHPKLWLTIKIILLIIVLALCGLIIWAVYWGNDIIAKITGGQGNIIDLIRYVEPTYVDLKTDVNGRTNILAFGTSGYNMDGDEGRGHHAGSQLTDSIMMISLNQKTGDIAMLSLPRDLKGHTCTSTSKINEVYWCNGGNGQATIEEERYAAQAVMNEVGGILGVDFQYFVHVNWASLIDIVNILGGITVTLDEDIGDQWWTGAVYKAGVPYTLNGEEALGLARARHGTIGGDFSRGASQQKILIGIKDKVFEKDLSITDFLSLASTLGDNLRTNISLDEIKSLGHLTFDFDFNNMRQINLWPDYMTTGGINGISYVLPRAGADNYSAIQYYVAKLLNNDPRTYEEPTILVLNATGEKGVAAAEQEKLEEAGYTVNGINSTKITGFTDKVTIYCTSDDVKGTKAMLEKYYDIKVKPARDIPEGLQKDADFIIVLGPSPVEEESEETEE
ncbi:LCP family protein [Candidatus Saccharibacteria bacterium]|nr:LCP family protein [Candidatus Saccharibacteria bacterium]